MSPAFNMDVELKEHPRCKLPSLPLGGVRTVSLVWNVVLRLLSFLDEVDPICEITPSITSEFESELLNFGFFPMSCTIYLSILANFHVVSVY